VQIPFVGLCRGPPGGGKGTIAKKIIKDFNFFHLSTGDVLRAHVRGGTEIGKKAQGFIKQGGVQAQWVLKPSCGCALHTHKITSLAALSQEPWCRMI
jgi:adenylate kinase family enzyme